MKQKEINWINWVKMICLALVYFDHSFFYSNAETNIIKSFYNPFFVNIFFFISGYLLFKKQLSISIITESLQKYIGGSGKIFIENIIYKIIFPTILFTTLIYFPKKIVRGDEITTLSYLKETILGGSAWFTCALAVAEILVLIMLLFRNRNILFYVLISCLLTIIALFIKSKGITVLGSQTLPWFYKGGMIATLYLALGGLYNQYEKQIDKYFGNYISCILLAIIYLASIIFIPESSIISLQITIFTIPGFASSLISIYVIIFFTKKLKPSIIINHLGRNTLGIYLLSGGIPNVLAIIFMRYGFSSIELNILCVTIISYSIGIIIVCILNKICPFVFNFRLLLSNCKKIHSM